MKSIVFDTSSVITIATNSLLWTLEPLKDQFKGEFFITESVHEELVDHPLNSRRYKLEAIMIDDLVNRSILKVNKLDIGNKSLNLLNTFNNTFTSQNKTIKILDLECFAWCDQLESVILHGVERIDSCSFRRCISLKYLFISDEIKEIHKYAFKNIPKEQEITIICPDQFYNYFKERFPNASINEKDYLLK